MRSRQPTRHVVGRVTPTSWPSNFNLRPLNKATVQEAVPVEPSARLEEEAHVQEVVDPASIEEVSDIRMASHMLKLESFNSDGKQTIETHQTLDQYKAYTGLNDAQALAAIAWHLDENARLWFDHLNPVPDSLEKLKESLTNTKGLML